jgi:NLI interacting factor-like phosphatase
LDPKGTIFTKCWYRESCVMDSKVGAYVKDLKLEWGNHLKRTVLVDNNPMSFLANPSNGILVPGFYNDPHDTALPEVLRLLEELNEEEDVRPMLESRFGLKQSLNEFQSGRNNTNSATKSPAVSALSGGVRSKRLRPVRKPKLTSDYHHVPHMMLSIIVEEAVEDKEIVSTLDNKFQPEDTPSTVSSPQMWWKLPEEGLINPPVANRDPVSDMGIQPAQTVHDQVEPMDWEPIDDETQCEEPCPTVTAAPATTQKCHGSKRLRPVRKLKLTKGYHRVPHRMLSTIVEEVVEDKEIVSTLDNKLQPEEARSTVSSPQMCWKLAGEGLLNPPVAKNDPVSDVKIAGKVRVNQTEPAEEVKKIPGEAMSNRATVVRRSERIAAMQLKQYCSPVAAGPESKAKQKAHDPTNTPSPRRSARIASKPRIRYRM